MENGKRSMEDVSFHLTNSIFTLDFLRNSE